VQIFLNKTDRPTIVLFSFVVTDARQALPTTTVDRTAPTKISKQHLLGFLVACSLLLPPLLLFRPILHPDAPGLFVLIINTVFLSSKTMLKKIIRKTI